MVIKKYILRLFFYPFGFIKELHRLGINGSRDILNSKRFKGVIIDNCVCIDEQSKIASNVHILENCVINHSSINSYTYIGKNCILQHATIGRFCSIGSNVSIGLGSHPIEYFSTSPLFYRKKNPLNIKLIQHDLDFKEYKPIKIGHDVWIGTKALIMDGVVIGNGAIIAANSVVTKNVPPYSIVGGSPAKIIRYRFDEAKITNLLHSNWWNLGLNDIKNNFINSNFE
jgi:chloramphenicol O-acetyltransferase type B